MTADNSQARQILESLRQGFVSQIPQRLAAIEQCWVNCHMEEDPLPALRELVRLAHSLRGSAKTFGQMALGEAAGNLEAELSAWVARKQMPVEDALVHVDALVAALRTTSLEVMDRLEESMLAPTQVEKRGAHRVYLLEDDPDQSRLLSTQLEHFGYRVTAFATPSALLDRLDHARPDVCILDIIVGDDDHAGIKLGSQLYQRDASLPIIFLSVRDDIEARLGAVHAGGLAYLTKPVDIGRMVEVVDQLTGHTVHSPYRILVVDDDASLASYYRVLLQDSGMEALAVTEPLKVLQAVEDFSPDLVLMDVYMPQFTGAELAQVIRQHGSHGEVPIVFLSVETNPDIQYAILRAGGDDFLAKPVDPRILVRAITIRAQRARLLAALMVRDGLTGLFNHGRIKEMLIAEVDRARRANATLAVAMLDLDCFKSINDNFGHSAGDRVIKSLARMLRERLRGSDMAGRFGGGAFLLILPDCDRESALHLVDDIRSRFDNIIFSRQSADQTLKASFSAGLATFPPATSSDELLLMADAALNEAKRRGRNCTR